MAAWWRNLRVLPARRRCTRVRFRRDPIFGFEQLEDRKLLAVADFMTAGDALSTSLPAVSENGLPVAGFVINKNTASVAENGTTDEFTVVLTAQPGSDVVLTCISADLGEATVSPAALTFRPNNWNIPQVVTVTGADDDRDDGIQYTDVTVGVDTVSSDPSFAAVEPQAVSVSTVDDDEAGFLLSQTIASVSENETTDTFTVHLTSPPDGYVFLTVISADPDEATVSPTVLTFSSADWNFPQTVTVTGVDDRRLDDSQTTLVTVSVADDESAGNFAEVGDQAVSVTTTDNDIAGFVLSKTSVTVSETGSTDTFTIALTAQPNSSVTLTAIGGDAGEATVSPAVLTFAPDEWDVPQTVTVTGVDDHRIDGSQTTSVTVSVAGAISDYHFDQVAAQTVSVTTTDDDVAGFTLSKSIAIVSEVGTTETFTVVLTAQPESDVTLTVTSSDTGEATVSPPALVFSPGGWDSPRTLTITGADDSSRDGDQLSRITVAVDAAQSDAHFGDALAQTVSVTTTDDDQGWQNSDNPFDVSGDETVDAADVLILINYINANEGSPTLPSPPTSPPPYYDVNNDGRCTAFDVLVVINFINNQITVGASTSGAGEGEGESRETPRSSAAPLDSPSEPSSVPSGDVQLVPAPYERAAFNPAWFSTSAVSTVGRVPSGLAEPTATTRAVLEPAPVAPFAALDPDRLGRAKSSGRGR